MEGKCPPMLHRSSNLAIFLSGTAFIMMIVSMPVLFTIMNNIEEELLESRVTYEEMSNLMWKDLLAEGEHVRRTRRQASYNAGTVPLQPSAVSGGVGGGPGGGPGGFGGGPGGPSAGVEGGPGGAVSSVGGGPGGAVSGVGGGPGGAGPGFGAGPGGPGAAGLEALVVWAQLRRVDRNVQLVPKDLQVPRDYQ
ncbi:nematode cuticle collagen domain protein, partial [Ancylostoma duodenale]